MANIRKIQGVDYVGGAKAMNRYKELKVHTDLMKEGETFNDFLNRVYYSTVWRIISATAITDDCVYRVDGLLREKFPELDELREGMMNYYDKFSERAKTFTTANEDWLADFKLAFGKKAKRKLTSLLNRARKDVGSLGFSEEKAEVIANLCVYLKFCDTMRDLWTESIKPLGFAKKGLPDYIPRPFFFLELTEGKAMKMINNLDPDEHEARETDETLNELYYDIVDLIFDTDTIHKAMDYSIKENGTK